MGAEARKIMPVPQKEAPRKRLPVRMLEPFEEMERLFGRLLPRGWMFPLKWEQAWPEVELPFEGRLPRVDVIDREAEVLVRAELPGVEKEQIEVAMTENTLTIKAETKHEEKEEKGEYLRCEIRHGAFARTVALPAEVDGTKAAARFKDGVLEIVLPKVEQAQRQLLKIE